MLLAMLIAIAVPLSFLYLVRWLDLYASGSFRVVVGCGVWGMVAFGLAFFVNTFALSYISYATLVTLVAPLVEEVLKSLALVYLVRRPSFTYFVDGAIYGFAIGTGFGVLENLLYLSRAGADTGLAVATGRAFSTSLMHGSATALVGVALGWLRFGHGLSRPVSLALGWLAAVALHLGFNNLLNRDMGGVTIILAMLIGLGGVGLNAGFILWGLREEGQWLRETLGLGVGVSAGEAAVVQQMGDLDRLLAPVTDRFGAQKRDEVESFLRLQAQLGLKRKVEALTPDAALRAELTAQVEALREEVDHRRRAIGIYCMSFVRSILPPDGEPLWARLEQSLATPASQPPKMNLWATLERRVDRSGDEGS